MVTHRPQRISVPVVLGFLYLTAFASESAAQDPVKRAAEADSAPQVQMPDSVEFIQQMESMSGMMDGMYRQMAETMMEVTLEVLTRPESAEKLATFTRNYYEALLRQGFTEEQALRIVAAAGVPPAPLAPGR